MLREELIEIAEEIIKSKAESQTIEVKAAEIALGTVDLSLCKERNDI